MALILRIDVDKPFGHKSFIKKVKSKLFEDYFSFSSIFLPGYLNHLKEFIVFCNENHVVGSFYFRLCTFPNKKIEDLLKIGGHRIGIHAENTRSFETLKEEIEKFKKNGLQLNIDSFTKHGSGSLKLGKYHYAPYEPDKYLEWASVLKIPFHSGNGIPKTKEDLIRKSNGLIENVFWLEKEYRDPKLNKLEDIIEISKEIDVVVLIHPSNFQTYSHVKNDLETLIHLAKENDVKWKFL